MMHFFTIHRLNLTEQNRASSRQVQTVAGMNETKAPQVTTTLSRNVF